MKQLVLMAMAFTGLALAACKKDDNKNTPPKQTTADLMTSATWKYDTVALDGNKDGVADTAIPPGYLDSCDLDNTITFKSDKTGIADEGPTKCLDTIPQSTNFTWSLSNNDSTLNIVGSSDTLLNGTIQIKQITNTNMVLLKNVTVNFGVPINTNIIVTLKK